MVKSLHVKIQQLPDRLLLGICHISKMSSDQKSGGQSIDITEGILSPFQFFEWIGLFAKTAIFISSVALQKLRPELRKSFVRFKTRRLKLKRFD